MLPDDIQSLIASLERRISNLERTPQGTTITSSDLGIVSFNLAAAGTVGDMLMVFFTLHNVNNLKLLGVPRWDLWKNVDGIDDFQEDDHWPLGNNWTLSEVRTLDITVKHPRYNPFNTHPDEDLIVEIFLRNRGATALTSLQIQCDWRLPLNEGSNIA